MLVTSYHGFFAADEVGLLLSSVNTVESRNSDIWLSFTKNARKNTTFRRFMPFITLLNLGQLALYTVSNDAYFPALSRGTNNSKNTELHLFPCEGQYVCFQLVSKSMTLEDQLHNLAKKRDSLKIRFIQTYSQGGASDAPKGVVKPRYWQVQWNAILLHAAA